MEINKSALAKAVKPAGDHNPIMVQRYGADPYAMVYKGRVYMYMTGDTPAFDESGKVKTNTYGDINTISVASSADLVNWTDHGEVLAAGVNGLATWGGNSWAPAAAWKNIDGKDKFFLYFANSGNGIAVLTADSPTGPFTDPIGGPLISRNTPNCAEVTWLFDPAVLIDDDGTGWLYVGGGIPSEDMASNPGTARVVKLGDDMISLATDPMPMGDVPYLFEDSGINKINGKYYYSYCSNFNVTKEGEEKYGFGNGEIVTLVSDRPDGPFTLSSPVLKNPEHFFGRGGNNHHCIFEFNGKYYIAYHSRILEEYMDLDGGYRSTNVDEIKFDEKGAPTHSTGTRKGIAQVGCFDPYAVSPAATFANMAGLSTAPVIKDKTGRGEMYLESGDGTGWFAVYGADFGSDGASAFTFTAKGSGKLDVCVITDDLQSEVLGSCSADLTDDLKEFKADLSSKLTGVKDFYVVISGGKAQIAEWKFVK